MSTSVATLSNSKMLPPTYIIQSYHWPFWIRFTALQWRHNECDSVSNHQPHDCLLNRLFRHISKKTSKLRVTGLCVGIHRWPVNSPHKGPVTGKMFPFDDVIMENTSADTSVLISVKIVTLAIWVDYGVVVWIMLRNKITCMRCHHS